MRRTRRGCLITPLLTTSLLLLAPTSVSSLLLVGRRCCHPVTRPLGFSTRPRCDQTLSRQSVVIGCAPLPQGATAASTPPKSHLCGDSCVRRAASKTMQGESNPLRPFCNESSTESDKIHNVEHHDQQQHESLAVTVLQQTNRYVVASKPPSVVCHHSEWTGSKARNEIPMLQRIRSTLKNRPVNLLHRLDRGCSGCLLVTYADAQNSTEWTRELNQALQHPQSIKTYIALVRGEGILHSRNFVQEGWFQVDRPIKDERGILQNATTWFRFVAGQDNAGGTIDRPRASLVLARPSTGRWHQIRRHLNGLSHPILGDSTHGNSKENRYWRRHFNLPPERTCLHLTRIQVVPTSTTPEGIDVSCPLAPDMLYLLERHMPELMEKARPIVQQECGMVL